MDASVQRYITEVLGVQQIIRPMGRAFPVVSDQDLTADEVQLLQKMLGAIGILDFAISSEMPAGDFAFALKIGVEESAAGKITEIGGAQILSLGPLSHLLTGERIQEEKRKAWLSLRQLQRVMHG